MIERPELDTADELHSCFHSHSGLAPSPSHLPPPQLFASYARVIKKCPNSPLLPLVLQGVAQHAHQVNLELLLDLCGAIRVLLRSGAAPLPPAAALACVHALLRALSGLGQALTVDTRDVQLRLYQLLRHPTVTHDDALLATALDCIEQLRRTRAALIAPRVASFIHRLLSLAATSPRAHALELLHATSRLTAACPRVGTVLQPDADDAVGAAVADLEDPDGPLALQSAAWQLPALRRHYHPAIARGARDICTQPPRGGS